MVVKQQKSIVHRAKSITLEELSVHFHEPINEVAKKFGVCVTVLKQRCREHGIARWPYRKVRKLDSIIRALQSSCQPEVTKASAGGRLTEEKMTIMKETRDFLFLNRVHLGKLASSTALPSDVACPLSDVTSNQEQESGAPGTGSLNAAGGCSSEQLLQQGRESLPGARAFGSGPLGSPWHGHETAADSEMDAHSLDVHSTLTESEATHCGKRARPEWRHHQQQQQQPQQRSFPPAEVGAATEHHMDPVAPTSSLGAQPALGSACNSKREEDCNFYTVGGGSSTELDDQPSLGELAERDLLEQFEIRDMESRHGSNFAYIALQGSDKQLPSWPLPPPSAPLREQMSHKEPARREDVCVEVVGTANNGGVPVQVVPPLSGRSAFRPLGHTSRGFGVLPAATGSLHSNGFGVALLTGATAGAQAPRPLSVAPIRLMGDVRVPGGTDASPSSGAATRGLCDAALSPPGAMYSLPRPAWEGGACPFDLSLCVDQSFSSATTGPALRGQSRAMGGDSAESQPPAPAAKRNPLPPCSPCFPSPGSGNSLPKAERTEASSHASPEVSSSNLYRPKPLSPYLPDAANLSTSGLPPVLQGGPRVDGHVAPLPPRPAFFFPVTSSLFASGELAAEQGRPVGHWLESTHAASALVSDGGSSTGLPLVLPSAGG